MPSFRAVLPILGLKPGHAPEEVMDTAVAALSERHLVEANQLDVVAGVPRITLRFAVEASTDDDENAHACSAAFALRQKVERVATTGAPRVLRRRRGKWLPVTRPPAS